MPSSNQLYALISHFVCEYPAGSALAFPVFNDEIVPSIRMSLRAMGLGAVKFTSITSSYVLRIGHGLKMIFVHAPTNSAQMVQLQAIRNLPHFGFIGKTVREMGFSVSVKNAISMVVNRPGPNDARRAIPEKRARYFTPLGKSPQRGWSNLWRSTARPPFSSCLKTTLLALRPAPWANIAIFCV